MGSNNPRLINERTPCPSSPGHGANVRHHGGRGILDVPIPEQSEGEPHYAGLRAWLRITLS